VCAILSLKNEPILAPIVFRGTLIPLWDILIIMLTTLASPAKKFRRYQDKLSLNMKVRIHKLIVALAIASALHLTPSSTAFAQGTAFIYQGQLQNNGSPANGSYDLAFSLFNAASNGVAVAGPLTNSATVVSNGLFSATLDFGPGVFTGLKLWLQVGVRTNGGSTFTNLSPLQPILSVPYAVMANTASNLLGNLPTAQLSGTISATNLTGTISLAQLPATVVTNGATGLTLTGAFSGNGAGLTNLTGGSIQSGTVGSTQLGANAVTAANIASNTITAAQIAPGFGLIPSGCFVLSSTFSNAALTAAGFAPSITVLGTSWTEATNAASWSGRYSFGAVPLNGQLWVLGGNNGSGSLNDVWSSSNGVTWTEATNAAPWGARYDFGAVPLNGQLWVLGGFNGGSYFNDVWSSSDGVNWTEATNSAPWSARTQLGAVSFNGQLWVMGGYANSGYLSDVWSSSNGVNWTEVTNAAPWNARSSFGAVAFNSQMWVLGGHYNNYVNFNDVWSSSNGLTWTEATNSAPWSARTGLGAVPLNGQLWVLGGGNGHPNNNVGDVWSSSDGMNWTEATNAAPWGARIDLGALSLNSQLWVVGGNNSGINFNDAWFSQSITNTLGGYYLFQVQ